MPWDVKKQVQIIKDELGWKGDTVENVPEQYDYEKIECYMQGVRDYIKYIKRGYTRPTHLASIDIRHNRLDREDALLMIDKFEGKRPPSLDLFLNFVGLTEAEFLQIAQSHVVSPHVHQQELITDGVKMHDFEQWSQDGQMNRADALLQLDNWKKRVNS